MRDPELDALNTRVQALKTVAADLATQMKKLADDPPGGRVPPPETSELKRRIDTVEDWLKQVSEQVTRMLAGR
jgi:hypothetical protein